MPLKLSCPHCLSMLAVPSKLRGSLVVCPSCKSRCRVPAAEPIAAEEAPAELRPPEVALYPPPSHNLTRTVLIASVAAAIVAVSGLVLNRALDRRVVAPNEASARVPSDVPATNVSLPGAGAVEEIDLAQKAQAVLEKHCHRCHGENGAAEGGFNFVLRRDRLVAGNQYITPGNADESPLLERIVNQEMPPDANDGALSGEEIDILRRWIAAGAPDFAAAPPRAFITNAELLRSIRLDLEKLPERQHRHTRYFTLTNLHNSGYSQDEMQTYRLALSKLVNSLSWHKQIVHPEPVDQARTIFRVDVRTLGWDDAVWEKIIAANPYSVRLDEEDRDGKFCLDATGCQVPHVRADWFVAAASRPPLYHDVLQLPATLDELLQKRFPEVDLKKDIQQESVARVGMSKSGVSQNNRLIEWHRASSGYFWISYDFAGNTGRRNLFQHPLGPSDDANHFEHDGGEIIFSLPNGLQGYMLVDAKNNRLDKAPTSIVTDPKRPDSAVTNGVSCMSCHYGGIIAKNDEVRPTVEANRTSFRDNADDILALYPGRVELDTLFAENAAQFRKAVEEVGIIPITETNEPVVNMALRFEADVDLVAAAAELGLTPEDFANRLKGNPRVQDRLGPLNVAGGAVKRELFAKEFTFVVEEFRLGTAVTRPQQLIAAADAAPPTVEKPSSPPANQTDADPQKNLADKLAEQLAGKPANAAPPTKRATDAGFRLWTDRGSAERTMAKLLDLVDNKVHLLTVEGDVLHVPIQVLTDADQQFVAIELANRDLASEPPTDLPPSEEIGSPARQVRPAEPPRPDLEYRIWTNLAIDESIEGALVYLQQGEIKIELKRYRGVFRLWPMRDMSPEDHAYVRAKLGDEVYQIQRRTPPRRPGEPPRLY